MTADTITQYQELNSLSDRQLLERVCRQLDHLDQMAHERAQFEAQLAPLVPLIPRALALLDPMAKIRRGRHNAIPQPETAPVHVGQAPAHSQEMGT